MKRPRSHRRALPAVLLVVLLSVAVWTGSFGTATSAALAADELLASNWSPAKSATGVALDASITVKFNRDLAAQTVSADSFYVTELGASLPLSAVTVSYNTVNRVATINPVNDLLPGTTYVVTLTEAIQSETGLPLSNPGEWGFTTDSAAEALTLSPTAGATNCSTSTNVTLTFDKPMDALTITASSFRLEAVGGSAVTASVSLSADKRTAILNPYADLLGGVTYIARLDSSVRTDSGVGVTGTPLSWTFTTLLAPKVVNKMPGHQAGNVPLRQPVSVTFDQDMDPSTLTTATFFVAKQDGSPLPATLAYNSGIRTATLTPLVDYEPGHKYVVTLTASVKGFNGATLTGAPISWSFTALADAPLITERTPENAVVGVSVTQSIHVVFDADMDQATLSPATFYIQPSGGSPLTATVAYNAATRTATLDPAAALENGTIYQVTLSAAVLGQSGLPAVNAPIIWFFTTATAADDFTDVHPGVTPYAAAIAQLADRGIITGFIDGTFRPYDAVSRQQFAKMIVLSLELPVTGLETCPFTDVAPQAGSDPLYPLKYVAVCAFRGITQGKTATSYAPYESITRQQIITMVARAARAPAPPVSFSVPFAKAQFSTSEHYQNACKAAYAGLLDGLLAIGPAYDFRAPCSRGECAQLLSSLVAYLD